MSFCSDELGELGHRLADAGPAALRDELAELALHAGAVGVDPLLLEVMCDEREPAVVRQRAFARVAARYGCLRRRRTVADESDMIIAKLSGDELDNDQQAASLVRYTG